MSISRSDRALIKKQRPCTIWLTGLSGAGKSTLAEHIEKELYAMDHHTYLLDGDLVRKELCKDLDYSVDHRYENIRRIGATAKLFNEAGLIVLVAVISPFAEMRAQIRRSFVAGEFIEVYVDAPLSVCEQRDPKGLYRKARSGEILDFTGISSTYEPPITPEIHLRTDQTSTSECVDKVIGYLRSHNFLLR